MPANWYVYELVDPRNDRVFYVGKGSGGRMYHHGRSDTNNYRKTRLINEIGVDKVIRRKAAEFWCEKSAYQHERERIESYSDLTNMCMPVDTIGRKRIKKPKLVSLLNLFKRFIMESNQDKKIEVAHKIHIHWPYRFINIPFAEEYNQILNTPERYLESIGCEIKYG